MSIVSKHPMPELGGGGSSTQKFWFIGQHRDSLPNSTTEYFGFFSRNPLHATTSYTRTICPAAMTAKKLKIDIESNSRSGAVPIALMINGGASSTIVGNIPATTTGIIEIEADQALSEDDLINVRLDGSTTTGTLTVRGASLECEYS